MTPSQARAAALERDNWQCRYCGKHARTVDHVAPKSFKRRPGTNVHALDNLVACCHSCNVRKGTRRYYPAGFDVTLLPGKLSGWQLWRGGEHLEVIR